MLSDPRLALRLYVAILAVAIMFSPRFGTVIAAIKSSKTGSGT